MRMWIQLTLKDAQEFEDPGINGRNLFRVAEDRGRQSQNYERSE